MNYSLFLEPISKVLVRNEFCSLRSVRNFLEKNKVFINKKRILKPSEQIDISKDELIVNNKILEKQNHIYILLNKPKNYVCAKESSRHPVVFDLILPHITIPKSLGTLHSVGRLDADTEGLLILTTNGSFSHKLSSPEFNVQKKYLVLLESEVTKKEQEKYKTAFNSGLILPAEKKFAEQKVLPAKIEFLSNNKCTVTLSEGKFHEVKRMFLAVGNKVKELKRIQFGNIKLDENLLPGKWTYFPLSTFSLIY